MISEVQAQAKPQVIGRIFPKHWRIRTKLLVSFVVVLAAPIMGIMVGIFTTSQAASTLRDSAIAEELAGAQSQATNVEHFLAQDRADVFTLNELSSLQNLLVALDTGDDDAIAQAKSAAAADFLAFANHEPSFYQVRYIDAAGQEIVRVDSKGGQTLVVPEAELQNKADRGYFQESVQLAEGELYVSRLDLNVEQGAIEEPFVPVIRYATPVFFDEEPAGIVITNIYAQEILDLIIPDAGDKHLLVDEDGFYLQHWDAAHEWGRDLGTGFNLTTDVPELSSVLTSTDSRHLEVGPTLYTHNAISVEGVTDRHWTLLTLRPTAEFVQEASQAPTILGIIALVTIIIGLVGTGLLARFFTRPIDVLADTTQRFAEGDFSVRVDETGGDELGQLAHTFNEMATAVQQREAEVRASEARYRLLFDSAPDSVSVLDTEGHIVNCNQATPLMFGRAEEELVGQHVAKVIGPSLADEMELFRQEFPKLRNLEITGAEFTHTRADGSTLEIWRKAIPLTDAENNFTGVLMYDRDITERKQAEDRIRTYATRMAQTSHELALSRKKAEDATKLKSEFMATMSHELRTPLNAIIGYGQILLAGIAGELTEKQHDFHERILLNGRNLLNLINDILDLSKIEAGRLDLVKQPFVLQAWLDEVVAQVQSLADNKELDLRIVLDDRMPEVIVGDADRLKQVALNLLSNAIKFTAEGHVKLHIQKQNDTWNLVISDTGMGIPSHAQEYIFDEFRQIDGTTRRKHGGTGLGLAIVRNLSLMMGGNVRVQSELDKGSTFTVLLPLVIEEQAPVANEL